jgi:hypothetical protein
MKTLKAVVLIALFGLFSLDSLAQFITVPPAVKANFASKYPQAHVKNWGKDHNEFVAAYKLNNKRCHAFFAQNGVWLSTETDIRIKDLDPAIKTYLKDSKYASYHIDRVEDVDSPGSPLYLVEVDNNSGNKVMYDNLGSFDDELLYFDHTGQFVKEVKYDNE